MKITRPAAAIAAAAIILTAAPAAQASVDHKGVHAKDSQWSRAAR